MHFSHFVAFDYVNNCSVYFHIIYNFLFLSVVNFSFGLYGIILCHYKELNERFYEFYASTLQILELELFFYLYGGVCVCVRERETNEN